MTFGDWTFESGSTPSAELTGGPTGQSAPWVKVISDGSIVKVFPTNGTVNGVSVLGLNQGVVETFWDMSTTVGTQRVGIVYRSLNKTSSNFTSMDGYVVSIDDNGSYLLRRFNAGAATTLTSGTDASLGDASLNWHKMRATWWKAGGVLYHKFEIQNLDGAAENPANWRVIFNGITDNTNSFENSANEVFLFSDLAAASDFSGWESTKFYSVA